MKHASVPLALSTSFTQSHELELTGSSDEYTRKVSLRLRELLTKFREKQPKINDGPQHWGLYTDSSSQPFELRGVIGIPTQGCSYARTEWAGCSVCGHSSSTLWSSEIRHDAIIRDVNRSLSELSKHRPPVLCLYTSGSFFDDGELPPKTRNAILREILSLGWVHSIVIESTPQFVTSDRLDAIIKQYPSLSLSIGMGLDSSNDFVRRFCLQRHFSLSQYAKAVKECNQRGISTTAYLVHKPIFLSLEEAVTDTATSISDAFELGFEFVSIEPVAIRTGAVQTLLHSAGFYDLPTIWSVVSSLVQYSISHDYSKVANRIHLGGQVFTPLPSQPPSGCEECVRFIHTEFKYLPGNFFAGLPLRPHNETCGKRLLISGDVLNTKAIVLRADAIISATIEKLKND